MEKFRRDSDLKLSLFSDQISNNNVYQVTSHYYNASITSIQYHFVIYQI